MTPLTELGAGEVGYVATGLKNVGDCQVGDTITLASQPGRRAAAGLPPGQADGLRRPLPGRERTTIPMLRDALEKLKLNDASLVYEPENSAALGFGFRCGFLGLLHMEIIQERLEREYDLDLLITAPSVEYQVRTTDGDGRSSIDNPSELPAAGTIARSRSRGCRSAIVTPDALHRRDHGAGDRRGAATFRRWTTSTSSACC